jgi:hypothetical protein
MAKSRVVGVTWFTLIWFAMTVIAIECSIGFGMRRAFALRTRGRHAQGSVIDKLTIGGGILDNQDERLVIAYQFQAGAVSVTDQARVNGWIFRSLRKGGPVDVVYLPERPEINNLAANLSGINFWIPIAAAALFTIVFCGLLAWAATWLTKRRVSTP